jgi:aminopeptidase
VVYPDLAPDAALEQLWQDVAHVCRLDEPDPARAWTERIDQIWQVARRLDALDLDELHFAGPGTDLTVGLLPSSRFAKEGGASHTRTGVQHVANIPTEEVYTTPDPERTSGVVTATKPLEGRLPVTGSASVEAARRDDRRRRERREFVLGGRRRASRLARSRSSTGTAASALGRTFFTTLLDENAASHLALGDGYSAPIGDPADLARINESAVHMDFMIGSDEVEVTGTTKAGETVPVMRDGLWQI